jgi:hypothetical protein
LFWKYRILDPGTNPTIEIGPVDLYIHTIPTFEYGFAALKSGHIPLWNPYQFCGEPFLGTGYTGLLYPFHLIMLFVDVLTANEVLFVFHMFLGALGMWLLMRHLGIGMLGGLTASVTFVWSGWMILNNTLPTVLGAMTWMPLIMLLIDQVALGAPFAWLGLTLALACQLLLGSVEISVHTLYLGALFTVCRLAQLAWRGEWRTALLRGASSVAGVGVAVLLTMPQLLPAVELAQQSTRAAGALTLAQVLQFGGAIPPWVFASAALQTTGAVTVGALPILAIPLALGLRKGRVIWVGAVVAAVGAMLLIFGGAVFRLYYAVPVLGSMFRRPMKFLDIYSFGQALLVGAAVARLEGWSDLRARELWWRPGWLASWVLGVTGLAWLVSLGNMNWYWAGTLALLALFGVLSRPFLRVAIVAGLCVLQGANLFFTVGDTHVRPVKRPQIYHGYAMLLESLKANLGDARVYLSPQFWFNPGLTAKQGMLRRMAVSIDYEPLAVGRYQKFFDTVSVRTDPAPFAGAYYLGPSSRWRLMDLTGSKFFVMNLGEPGEVFMKQNTADFRFAYGKGQVRVFEKRQVLPHAYFVGRARTLSEPDEVLAALDSPGFDPRGEVLLEEAVESLPTSPAEPTASSEVRITSYEPERVAIAARAETPGFLVLGDLFYPGWKAFIGDAEVPIYRANYLFRAVRLEPGSTEVRFEYHPVSFRRGVMLSAVTTLAILVACVWARWRK